MTPAFFVCILMGVGLAVVALVLYSRNQSQQLVHRERMVALEKGVALPPVASPRPWSPRVYLLRGLIWSFCGTALIVCLLGLATASHRPKTPSELAFEAKQLSDEAGISREEAKQLVDKDAGLHPNVMPFSVALLGLIPLAVGLAYLVFYYTGESDKTAGVEARVGTGKV